MATAASRENEENTATGGQRTWDGNCRKTIENELHQGVLVFRVTNARHFAKLFRSLFRTFAIPNDRLPTLYIACGAALIKWAWSTAHKRILFIKRILACSLPL